MTDDSLLLDAFEQQRPRLRAVAYRLLGSTTDAEDAVQEAWIRLERSDMDSVDNLNGWLTTVVARISLNMLRSRQHRHESSLDVHYPDLVIGPADGPDPERAAVLGDAVGLALLVVLETLSPAERLAFVMHDVFGVPFQDIATTLDTTSVAARQLASRARRRVQNSAPRPDGSAGAQRAVVDAFYLAGRTGDFTTLMALLHPDVVLRVDSGVPGAPTSVVRGSAAVGARARMFAGTSRTVRPVSVNGSPGVLVFVGERMVAVMAFTVADGQILVMDVLSDPRRLETLDLSKVAGVPE